MKINIKLKGNREITTDIDEENYEELKRSLMGGGVKFFNLEDKLIRVNMIDEIEPVKETILTDKRLPEPEYKNKTGRMKKIFDVLKSRNLFQGYNSYEEWEKSSNKN